MNTLLTKDITGQKFLEPLKSHPCFGGLDLAAVADLTAFVLVWPIKDQVFTYPWFFLPEDGLAERSRRDGVGYEQWLREGFLEVTPGSITDWHYVTGRIKQLSKIFKIQDIGFDQYGARDTVADLMDVGISTTDVSQGILSISAPSKRLEELAFSKKLVHTGHPILRWNLDCVQIKQDENFNIKPCKPDVGKSSSRIDGIIALIMALSRLQKSPIQHKSVYATRGVLTL